jgi:hypothetical protein
MGKKRKPVLTDHARKGKTLVAPLVAALPNLRLSSWHRDQIPEVVWIGLLLELYGLKRGTELALCLAKAASSKANVARKPFFGLASAYLTFSDVERTSIVTSIGNGDDLVMLRVALEPLMRIYEECPLRFLGPPEVADVRLDGEARLRRTLSEMHDKTSVLGMRVLAASVYVALVTDKLKVMKGQGFEDFEKIADYPSSSVPDQLPGMIRATFGGLFGSEVELHPGPRWAVQFWRRGFAYSRCELAKEASRE